MVSQRGQAAMAKRFSSAKATQARSTTLSRDAIARMTYGLDRGLPPELAPDPPDAYVDDIRAWIEVAAPNRREDALASHHLPGMRQEEMEKPEFPVGELGLV